MFTPRQTLNKAYLKVKPNRSDVERFKTQLTALLDSSNDAESEEFHKNLVSDFLKRTWYEGKHFINTKGRNDLVIHNGAAAGSTVGVIIEAKKPTNKAEMPQAAVGKLNSKALQELVLYYLRERITHNNLEVKQLVITNIREWFVFDAQHFDRLFAQNKTLVKQFTEFEAGRLSETKTDFFYRQIAEPAIAQLQNELPYTWFQLADYEKALRNADKSDDTKLIALYKLLSPEHLLKLPFANDSNSLDKRFYSELLHIIGLTEIKDGGKKLIQRNKAGERHSASLLEDAIIQLDSLDKLSRLDRGGLGYGSNTQDRLFNVALELVITWVNRILFLKLLEAQLLSYHKGDKAYAFLNGDKIKNYDDLNSLFFQVLARRYNDRNEDVQQLFARVPYLNSSLFEPTELEQLTLFISNLRDDKQLPLYTQTVLKDEQGRKRTGSLGALSYLFAFLDAYDFSSEGAEDIQEDNKTLINASVLGLIFEKINGYKDGSFFTPGFITMYMCRETIRKAVVQKFNEAATPLLRGAGGVSAGAEGVSNAVAEVSRKAPSVPPRTIIPYYPSLKLLARELRNNSTKTEIMLWKELKGKFAGKYDFHRQKPLDNYIADFFCYELKLVIELDGITHEWEETQKKDFAKECRLNELGLNVLRFDDDEVYDRFEQVLQTIRDYVAGFEKGDLSSFQREDTPLNPLSRAEFVVNTPAILVAQEDTPLNPLSRGDLGVRKDNDGAADAAFFNSLDDVYEQIGNDRMFTRQQANDIVNSIKICDPAVGSGHFLVSALNEMIAVKNDLNILQDREGRRLKEYQVEVVNDELIVTDEEGELFEYNPRNQESQRIQETLFHEKQTIIENCLFGVDINPNSVKICRLRLWIELLKNAYYKTDTPLSRGAGGVLETLPNIDINIKVGNSLVSRFAMDADLKQTLRKSKWNMDSYRLAVSTYRNAQNKEQKREMERLIASIKSDFRSEIAANDPKIKRLQKLEYDFGLLVAPNMFAESAEVYGGKANQKKAKERESKMLAEINKLKADIEEIKANKIYENAFEWRFEFPEVLNNDGDFVGFDVVIGNPPYMRVQEIQASQPLQKLYYEDRYQNARAAYDLANIFFELAVNISSVKSNNAYIFPHKFFNSASSEVFRDYLKTGQYIDEIAHFGANMVFEDADTYTCVAQFSKRYSDGFFFQRFPFKSDYKSLMLTKSNYAFISYDVIEKASGYYGTNQWILFDNQLGFNVFEKMYSNSKLFSNVFEGIFVGLQTSRDELYVVDCLNDVSFSIQVPISGKKYVVERNLFKPFLMGKNVQRYSHLTTKKYVFFPYEVKNGKATLVTLESIKRSYPSTYCYLMDHESIFKARENGKAGRMVQWHDYIYPKNLNKFEQPKLTSMEICANHPNVTLNRDNLYHTTKAYSWVKKDTTKESYEYLLAVANSKLMWWFLKITGDTLQGDARTFKTNYLNPFPLPKEVPYEVEAAISEKVNQVLDIKKQNPIANTTALEAEIDQLVYGLYGLTEEEIKVVEGV